jgi:NTP pyrophosphatase (non-canonical NTP hydrolase)
VPGTYQENPSVDHSTTVQELAQKAIRFRDDRNWKQFHNPKNLAMGMSIECAELQELFLWRDVDEVQDLLGTADGVERVSEELADVFVFLLYLADACNVDLSEAVRRKLEVNERKYPVDKSYSSHRKYTELT